MASGMGMVNKTMRKRSLIKNIKKHGYKIIENHVDNRIQDSINWYWTNSEPILAIEKNGHRLELICAGDIRIYTERKSFIYKGGNPDGILTSYIKKHGRWENNNWFEINENGSSYNDFEDPYFDMDTALDAMLSRMR